MKHTLLLYLFIVSYGVANACSPGEARSLVKPKTGIHAQLFPVCSYSPFSPRYMPVFHIEATFRLQSADMYPWTVFLPTGNGIPFCSSAVFCRMENQCLGKYNFKFSIHTGGYREY